MGALAACGDRAPAPSPPSPAAEAVSRLPGPTGPPAPAPAAPPASGDCGAGPASAAQANAASLSALPINLFGRAETGWEIYAPRAAREIGTTCEPGSPGFAAALARWQGKAGLAAGGIMTPETLARMKRDWQLRRPFVVASGKGVCPAPPAGSALESGRAGEGYGGKAVQLRPEAFAAYRRMAAAAKAERPEIAADPRNLTIFSAFRSPAYDAARCARDGNCNGVVRATCSPHRTGLAMDLYVGEAPGFGPDSTADPNRLAQSRGPAYRWLVENAERFGFANYPFEPWHWEYVAGAGP